MRAVLIGPVYPYRGGIAHYTTMLARALNERGQDLLLVSFKRQYPQWLFPGRSDKDPSRSPLEAENAQYWIDPLNPLTWVATFSRIRRYSPDAIVLQWWTTFWSPLWCALGMLNRLFLHKPLIYVCHNVLPHERGLLDPILARAALRWGTQYVVQSSEEKTRLQALIPGARIDIVRHPIYDMFADRGLSKKQARRQLGLPLDLPVLLFFGIVREYKGLRDLLTAMPRIEARLGRVMLVVAGEFWEDKRAYEKAIQELGIGDSVVLEDRYIPNEEVAVYFSAADVLVAPYRRATGSGAVQMALGCDCPVVTTCVGELHEVVVDGISGLITKPSDSQALAEGVIRYFEEMAEYPDRGQRGGDESTSGWETLVTLIEDAGKACESSSY